MVVPLNARFVLDHRPLAFLDPICSLMFLSNHFWLYDAQSMSWQEENPKYSFLLWQEKQMFFSLSLKSSPVIMSSIYFHFILRRVMICPEEKERK
ncbi:hypothetical protein TNIN_327721 [Trichonephila inaurata madagascariensis]|uniref:Uncharacterized protein n=1 Tax=Trichonephila inaurata madagascariensis TaxID=2747483 RepID=A0A8X6IBM1_9ARAC|nr:hypothetical protein TNIN_327721 [Trichonephila inaurata madagascariensis]